MSESPGAQTLGHLDTENAESDPPQTPDACTQDKDTADGATSDLDAPAPPMKSFTAMWRRKGGNIPLSSGSQTLDSGPTKIAWINKKKDKDDEDKKKKDKDDEDKKKKKKTPARGLA
ncbi:hypothetical protein FIBSPDRAFT_1048622 [Athelia psychrophila]|uniref:Uncharacterized protein n=1 Tax=Athelia psychrophila TaxID=1759441 RepID=A0A166DHY0_9AGAM|nr:hypothetical protein FIBSPDRAFT_1048622 [Fibularhizoctonia sp. CBS 109695]